MACTQRVGARYMSPERGHTTLHQIAFKDFDKWRWSTSQTPIAGCAPHLSVPIQYTRAQNVVVRTTHPRQESAGLIKCPRFRSSRKLEQRLRVLTGKSDIHFRATRIIEVQQSDCGCSQVRLLTTIKIELNKTPCLILMHSGLSIDRSVASVSRWKRRRKRVWAASVTRAANPFAGSCRFD